MPHGEIGQILGIPEGTARRRMHTALGMLRQEMGVQVAKKERR